ncbi:unnamed protein product [Staurois parvus]|uniref:Uncharacterized protein n=1 Tax=Staurois parvus TaxID=386267 RepID=A0ABN9EX25_9NEOB|nr:unnamed protein product [Staurois parvus]
MALHNTAHILGTGCTCALPAPPFTVKHTQHTVNPLIGPHVNPFLPSAISALSVLLISTDHCIGVTGCQ